MNDLLNTRVGHWKKDACDVYVGRGSIWGNPFARPGTKSRYRILIVDDPIRAYEEMLLRNIELLERLPLLRGKILGCWCIRLHEAIHPILTGNERCHGEVLAKLADFGVSSSGDT